MKLVIVYIVQKHIHTGKVIGGVVDFLPKETVFDNMSIKLLFRLQQQRTGTGGWIVNFVYQRLLVDCQLCNELGNALRGKKLPSRFACIGSIIRD